MSYYITIVETILQFFGLPTVHPDARTASHENFWQFVLLVALRERERERERGREREGEIFNVMEDEAWRNRRVEGTLIKSAH
jgi:hypothetical protein